MSHLYQEIPPERIQAFGKKAELVINEAMRPNLDSVVTEMGKSVITDAVEITRASAGESISDSDVTYMEAHALAEKRAREQADVHSGAKSFGDEMAELAKKQKVTTLEAEFAQKYLQENKK